MAPGLGKSPRAARNLSAAALTAAALMLAACGGAEPDPTPFPTPTPAAGAPDSTPTPTAAAWRSGIPTGPAAGDRAPDVTLTLPDGQAASLQELAAGKPLLLYFFATW